MLRNKSNTIHNAELKMKPKIWVCMNHRPFQYTVGGPNLFKMADIVEFLYSLLIEYFQKITAKYDQMLSGYRTKLLICSKHAVNSWLYHRPVRFRDKSPIPIQTGLVGINPL